MYKECPVCKNMVRIPDIIKNENQFEHLKCFNCNSDLSYLDNNSILLKGNLLIIEKEKIIQKEEIKKKLREYENICDEAIDEAKKEKIEGSINWSDLKCTDVRYSISVYGIEGYDFYIDEASPDNDIFKDFIHRYIKEKIGEKFIEIFTEW